MTKLLLPNGIRGFEEGFNEVGALITETADGASLQDMWREFQETLRLWNSYRQPLLSLLTYDVTSPTEKVMQPSSEKFEEASEFGEPTGIRLGKPFLMGYDFTWHDLAVRYTWRWLAESTGAEAEAINNTVLDAGNQLLFDKVLGRLFNNTNSLATIDDQEVNVYTMYNGDGTVPPKYRSNVHTSGHNHYLVSGAAALVSEDLGDMQVHLEHHGYTNQLGYRMILLVNRQESNIIRGFTVAGGDTYDFIPNSNVSGGLITAVNGGILGQPSDAGIPGSIGTYGPWVVVEDDYIPAGYVAGFATGGERNLSNPIGVRQHANPALRGLRLVKGAQPDYPIIDSYYVYAMGTGVRHRGAGVVMQIKASGTYDIPAAYV